MPDYINYVAVSGDYVRFGMAEDPAADVATMRDASPVPIDIAAGWLVPPGERAWLQDKLDRVFRRAPHRNGWVRVPVDQAVHALASHAEHLGGTRWKVRKRPLPLAPSERARPVLTPRGRYQSAQAAADAYGMSRQAVWERATRRSPGWRFEDDDSPEPVRGRPGRPRKEMLLTS
jgi:hypothetical protein